MQNNPMFQFMNMMRNAQNPQAMFKQRFGNDPAYSKTMEAIKGKNPQQIQEYVMNVCQSKGIDINQVLSQFGMQV